MGALQWQCLEISMFLSHAIWSFKKTHVAPKPWMFYLWRYVNRRWHLFYQCSALRMRSSSSWIKNWTIADFFNAVQYIFKYSVHILSFTGAHCISFATSCQFPPLVSNFTCIYLCLRGGVCLIHFSHSHLAYSRLFVHGHWKERLVSLYKWIFYRTISSLSSLVHLQLMLISVPFKLYWRMIHYVRKYAGKIIHDTCIKIAIF